MDKLIYIFPNYSTFVKKDIDFLSKRFIVKTPKHDWKNKRLLHLSFLKQFIFLLRHSRSSKAMIIMFGGYWSFLPTLLGKIFNIPTYIILGGTDCVSFPSFNYGSLRKPILKTFIKWSYMLCKRLLPVDESLIFSKNTYSNTENTLQGFKYYFPSLKTPYSVINNGFETEKIKTDISKKIKNTFVAVAPINDLVRFRLKGIDKIFDLAKKLPNCSFSIVGISSELKISLQTIPENITLYEFLPFEIFRQVLEKSEFYFQLSISEGFPNALCEAMLCNCIPIGSDVGAIPYIIGESGFVMKYSEINYLTEELSKIIDLEDSKRYELALNSRKRIVDNFDISKREKAFLNLIENKLYCFYGNLYN